MALNFATSLISYSKEIGLHTYQGPVAFRANEVVLLRWSQHQAPSLGQSTTVEGLCKIGPLYQLGYALQHRIICMSTSQAL